MNSEKHRHMEAVHDKTVPCAQCDKKFYGQKELGMHIQRWHTDRPVGTNEN